MCTYDLRTLTPIFSLNLSHGDDGACRSEEEQMMKGSSPPSVGRVDARANDAVRRGISIEWR